MSESKDDKIEDVLVDSELAKMLVPNKFKFTSQQGRVRRQKLLAGAKKLSETQAINDITLAAVCEEAGIPRASAYHFFPNIEAIFLALRFLNAIELLEILQTVETGGYDRWQGYLTALIDRCVQIFHEDQTKAKLIYDTNTPDFEGDSFGEDIDHQIVNLVYKRLSERYEMPSFDDIQDTMLIAYSIINAIFTLSYRRHQAITDEYIQEANTAFIAYLRCYLPEKLPAKKGS
ncbi:MULTISPECIES: TetR/AcrR family transcriptional regulator [unclassified Psychrobacter]|uniref:TetR/AcrR family transcriptional regulator n=1 Tax=unclassified Psychrobacter TaxID=196806 RepID=UPI00293D6F9A|nr:TetR/AcrR family transcriptional regulator [uncultured Psychrobacter sp.]